MKVLSKYIVRVKQYGRQYVWSIILRNKIYLPISRLLLRIFELFFKNAKTRNTIIIESHNDFDCNGGAIYDYLLRNGYNNTYKIIWLLKHHNSIKLPNNVYGFNIWKPSLRKFYYISTAKFSFCDDVITPKVNRHQITVYCTHGGVTFKNVKGKVIVPDYVDYILSSSKNYDPYMCSNYSIPYPNNRMLHFGFPRHDVFFKNSDNELVKITNKKFNHVILWMPTFRKGGASFERNDSSSVQPLGIPLFNTNKELEQLNRKLIELNCYLIIKIHPMQDITTFKELKGASNIKILDSVSVKELNIDNYRLMKYADALISDYSSVAYSFLLLNRPLAFVLEDFASYNIGFSVQNYRDFLPGEKIYSIDDFVAFIERVTNGEDIYIKDRTKLLNWLYDNTTEESTEKLLEYLGIHND